MVSTLFSQYGPRLGLLLALFALGCATTKAIPEPKSSLGLLEALSSQAEELSDTQQIVLRYNPCQCACSPFEVQLGGRWVRAELDDLQDPESPAARLLVQAQMDHDSGLRSEYPTPGTVRLSEERCDGGVAYTVVSVGEAE